MVKVYRKCQYFQ